MAVQCEDFSSFVILSIFLWLIINNTTKYERYYGLGRCPLAYLLYYMHTVSPACA